MRLLNLWDFCLHTRVAAAADVFMLPIVAAWATCLLLDRDLLATIAPLAALGSRAPQIAWAAFCFGVTGLELYGLVRRARHLSHRTPRLWATLGMGIFFAWLAGETMVRDPGLPGAWYFAWFAAVCLVGAGRLLSIRTEEESSRL